MPEGLQAETIRVYDAALTPATVPQNQDFEGDAIETRPIATVVGAVERDNFTLESVLALLESLTRRAGIESPNGL